MRYTKHITQNTVRKSLFLIPFLLLSALISCNSIDEYKTRKNWSTIRITSDWLVDVPKDFKRQEFSGIDSEIGSIYSKNNSINLEYETWNGTIGDDQYCNLQNKYKRLTQEVKNLKTQYSYSIYEFVIEKINGQLALIVYPKDGNGDYRLEIYNCEAGSPLVLEGIDMKNQKMILEIFRTVRYNEVNK